MDLQSKLFLSMILKDDEPIEMVKRSIDSVKDHVDEIYITITYSAQDAATSPLIDLLKSYNAKISFFKWTHSFADARNFAMEQVPKGKNNFIYWHDADDVLDKPELLKPIMADMVALNQAAAYFNYWYMVDLDKNGNVREILIEHKRERIVRHDGTFKWIGMLHETLIEQRQENVIKVVRPECIVVHLTTPKRLDINIDRNLKILETQAAKEEHKDPRTLVYLAKAYVDKAQYASVQVDKNNFYDLAFMLFNEYLNGAGTPGNPGYIEGSGWPEERANAWAYIAEISRQSNKFTIAIQALHNAMIEDPYNPMYYVDMAMTYGMIKDFQKARHWLTVATYVPQKETTTITTPRDLKTKALEVDYTICIAEGKLDKAVEDSEMLCEILPDVAILKERLNQAKGLRDANRAAQSIVFIGKYLEVNNESAKLPFLVQAIPSSLQQEKFASEMRHKFFPPRTWEKNEVAIVCGPGWEQWSPKSIKTGLGGSEEAVVYLSQELHKLGWKVTVYANPAQDVGNYGGIEYRPWYEMNIRDQFNVLILWRNIGFIDMNPIAKYKIVWLHDIPNNPDFTEERVNKVDKIAVLSEYHKSQLRLNKNGEFLPMPEEKLLITGNGIQDVVINKKWVRDSKKMIYTSSPDRGLVYLLNNWPLIRKEVPDAKLEIYYGFTIYDAIHANNPARMRWKQQILDLMKQEGITYGGRIGHADLNRKFAEAGIWAYPTDFTEISCISAMKAQALGAIPVTTDFAALKETVKNGIRVGVDIQSNVGQQEYLKVLTDLLKDEKRQEEMRIAMMPFAQKHFAWSNIGQQWNDLFKYIKEGGDN